MDGNRIAWEVKEAFYKMWNELKRSPDDSLKRKVAHLFTHTLEASRVSIPELMRVCKTAEDILPKKYGQILTNIMNRCRPSARSACEDVVSETEPNKSKNVKAVAKSKVFAVKNRKHVKMALTSSFHDDDYDDSDSFSLIKSRKKGKKQPYPTCLPKKPHQKSRTVVSKPLKSKEWILTSDSSDDNDVELVSNPMTKSRAEGYKAVADKEASGVATPKSVTMLIGGRDSSDGSSTSDDEDSLSLINSQKTGKTQSNSNMMIKKSDPKRAVVSNPPKSKKFISTSDDSTNEDTNNQTLGAVAKRSDHKRLNSGLFTPKDRVGIERVATRVPKSVAMLMGGCDSSDGSSTSESEDQVKPAPIIKSKRKILPHIKRLQNAGARSLDKNPATEKPRGFVKPRFNRKNLTSAQLAKACPFACVNKGCNAVFVSQRNLNRHSKTCGNNHKFKCKVCGKQYTTAYNLKAHAKDHEGGWKCMICSMEFHAPSTYYVHIRKCKQ